MSAWLVTKEHIDVLVTAGIALSHDGWPLPDEGKATEAGTDLWQENVRSLHFRYGDDNDPVEYTFKPYPVEDLLWVYKQLNCYDYQACENNDYAETWAKNFVNTLGKAILAKLDLTEDEARDTVGYRNAPWGVPELASEGRCL